MKCLLIKIHDYLSIIFLLGYHLRKKWRLETSGIISILFMMFLGLLLSTITSIMYNYELEVVGVLITYVFMTVGALSVLITAKSNLTFSRLLYESKYFVRLFNFMRKCYQNLIKQYKIFLELNAEFKRTRINISYDLTVIRTIFLKIFKMYFDSMYAKQKNSEPYLIDTQEMKNLYTSKEFNDFYSTLFFNPSCTGVNTPYEQVLIHILDEVMTTLYKKSWFVDYYDEKTVFQLVKYILSNWYESIVEYSMLQKFTNEKSFI